MQLTKTALLASMCFSALVVSACEPKRVAVGIKPPADKLVCVAASKRPTIAPEYQINWADVKTVPQAQAEHNKYVGTVRERERQVSVYVLDLEGQLYACASNAAWLRDYYAKIPD